MYAIAFPAIDPIALQIGPFALRWYALAYVTGIVAAWRYMLFLGRRPPERATARDIDDFVVWATLAIVLGGRLGYVLFYRPGYYLDNPLEALALWRGGMSFHGGLLGVLAATILFARKRRIGLLAFGDILACAAPIGLFLGRIANFINGELFGRFSDVPWAMAFPRGGPTPRHPSQLYEAALEGLVLFAVLAWLALGTRALNKPGLLSGAFFTGYGIARIVAELFRQPDAHLGFLGLGTTMGQLLSLPLVLGGVALIYYANRRA